MKNLASILCLSLCTVVFGCTSKKDEHTSHVDESIEELIQSAKETLSAGKSIEAIHTLESMQEQYPDNIAILEALAFAHSDTGDHSLAAFYFEQIANKDASKAEFRIFAAQAYEAISDSKEAARNYEGYLMQFPNDGGTWKSLSKHYKSLKEHQKLLKALEEVRTHSYESLTIQDRQMMVKIYVNNGQTDEAKMALYGLRADMPRHSSILLGLIKLELEEDNVSQVKELLGELDRRKLNDMQAAYVRDIELKVTPKEESEVIKIETASVVIEAEDEIGVETVDEALLSMESLEAAEEAETLIQNEIEQPLAENEAPKVWAKKQYSLDQYVDLSHKALNQGMEDKAVEYLWQAVMLDPNKPEVWAELSGVLLQAEDLDNAEMTALEATRKAPENPEYLYAYLKAIRKKTLGETWLSELRKARVKHPAFGEFTLEMADYFYKELGNEVAAQKLYQEFLSKYPKHAKANQVEALLVFMGQSHAES